MPKANITFDDLIHDRRLLKLTDNAANYGVAAAVIDYGADSAYSDGGYYIVGGLGTFPDISETGISPRNMEKQLQRNKELYYPKYYSRRINASNIDVAVSDFNLYCQRTEVIIALFLQYNCPVPDVMRESEVNMLIQCNEALSKYKFDIVLSNIYEKELEKFFQREKKALKSKIAKEYLDYFRSDRCRSDYYGEKAKDKLGFLSLNDNQEISFDLLLATGAQITEILLPEEEYQEMRKILRGSPYVFYSSGKKEVSDHGRIGDELDPWREEKRHFENRRIFYKAVDEPEIASAWIQARYVHTLTKDSIMRAAKGFCPPEDRPTARYVPYRAMDSFLKKAVEERLPFTFDIMGVFLEPSWEKIPIVVSKQDSNILDNILLSLDEQAFREHDTFRHNLPYLSSNLQAAEIKKSAIANSSHLPDHIKAFPAAAVI
ncbi:MAG: hypothetical protein IJ899_20010 [Blautia sp.]|nr:hypothetical protein [Blautia sp.]